MISCASSPSVLDETQSSRVYVSVCVRVCVCVLRTLLVLVLRGRSEKKGK